MQEAEGRFGRGTHFKRVNQYVNVTEEETPLPLPKKKKKKEKAMEREAKSRNKETTLLFLFSQLVCFFFFCLQRESRGELILDLEKKKRGVWGGGVSNNILA